MRIAQQPHRRYIHKHKRYSEGKYAEDAHLRHILFQPLQVHLYSSEKHYIEQPHAPEQLKAGVTLQNVKAILTQRHTRQHHAYDMRNTQFSHHYRCEEDSDEYNEENHRRVSNREVLCQFNH